MNTKHFITTLFLVLIMTAGNGCTKQPKQVAKNDKEESGSVSVSGNVSEISNVEVRGEIAPNFSFRDANGQKQTFDSFKGKLTFINFWATWCGPCKMELPDLIALSGEYSGKNVRFIGISTDQGTNVLEDVKSFVQQSGIPYQIVIANDEIVEAYGNINAIPTSFLVDENGKIVQKFVGVRSKAIFSDAINQALGGVGS